MKKPETRKVARHVSLGMNTRRREPLATNSHNASSPSALVKNGRNCLAFATSCNTQNQCFLPPKRQHTTSPSFKNSLTLPKFNGNYTFFPNKMKKVKRRWTSYINGFESWNYNEIDYEVNNKFFYYDLFKFRAVVS